MNISTQNLKLYPPSLLFAIKLIMQKRYLRKLSAISLLYPSAWVSGIESVEKTALNLFQYHLLYL